MDLILLTPPTSEPITLTEAKLHLRMDGGEDDTLITALIQAAREVAETSTDRALMAQTWRLYRDCFPEYGSPYVRFSNLCQTSGWSLERQNSYRSGQIELHKTPLTSVSSVKYYDIDGVLQTWSASNYVADTNREPGRVYPAYNVVWPTTRPMPHAVIVEFIAGYANAAAVPQKIKQAMLMMIANWYENREVMVGGIVNKVPLAADALLKMEKVHSF